MNTSFTRGRRGSQGLAGPGSVMQKTLVDHYTNMHDVSRHLIHVSETLHLSRQIIEKMIDDHTDQCHCLQQHGALSRTTGRASPLGDQPVAGHISCTLSMYASLMSGLEARTQAFQERLSNETKLVLISKRCL